MTLSEQLRLVPNKIKKNGFKWILKRAKYESLNPQFMVTRYLVKRLDPLRQLFKWPYSSRKSDVLNDTLMVVYDLNVESITFDFTFFLAAAETYAKQNGKSKLFILFVQATRDVLIDQSYSSVVGEDSQEWRLTNILLQLARLYPACSGYALLRKNSEAINYICGQLAYPPGYSSTYRPAMEYKKIFPIVNLKAFSGFSASSQGLLYIQKWLNLNHISKPVVVITLRQYGYDTARNSNISEWIKFADWVSRKGFMPVFVPDTDACWCPNKLLNDYIVFTEPCWNLGLRLALYELAFVNFFYSNGLGMFGLIDKKVRLIAMVPIIEESLGANYAAFVEDYGLTPGQRRYDFSEPHQLLSWKRDIFENIRDEFLEFEDFFPLKP